MFKINFKFFTDHSSLFFFSIFNINLLFISIIQPDILTQVLKLLNVITGGYINTISNKLTFIMMTNLYNFYSYPSSSFLILGIITRLIFFYSNPNFVNPSKARKLIDWGILLFVHQTNIFIFIVNLSKTKEQLMIFIESHMVFLLMNLVFFIYFIISYVNTSDYTENNENKGDYSSSL